MTNIPPHINGTVRIWLESPPPKPLARKVRPIVKCGEDDCHTWCVGKTKEEADQVLASHRKEHHRAQK